MSRSDFEQLTEVRKGQAGTGLLIENDWHAFKENDSIQQIREDIANGHQYVIPEGGITMVGLFQRANTLNANGRIYPMDVLKPAVDKYIRERVMKNCAIGALNHPECVFGETLILTEKGWKQIKDVEEGENILTLNPETKKIEIKPVQRKIVSEYNGKMIRFSGRFMNVVTTPNHRFPIFGRDKKFKGFYTSQQIMDKEVPDQGHSYLWKTGDWDSVADEYFEIPALEPSELKKITRKDHREKYSQPLHIPTEIWMKFMGIYLSEGCARRYEISIAQKKEEVCNAIEEMLDEFPLNYKVYFRKDLQVRSYKIFDVRLAKYLQQFGNCYTKYVPYFIKKQPKELLRIFYDWFVMGDGRRTNIKIANPTDDVFSTSKQMVMDLNEIQLKIGYCGSYHEEDRSHDRYMYDRLIEGKNCQNMHFTYRCLTNAVVMQDKSFKISEEDYNGLVYCVEVENHTFYMMGETGKCLWTGNSSALSGHDVSHVITELHWEGDALYGTLKLHLSPGYIRYGVCSTSGDLVANMVIQNILFGVSSRALGTVKQLPGNKLVVDDNLEILAWDTVAEPSTPGAWLARNREELRKYMEGKSHDDSNKQSLDEKIASINRVLQG